MTHLGLHDQGAKVARRGENVDAMRADHLALVARAEVDGSGLAASSFVARDRTRRPWQRRWSWYLVTLLDPSAEPDRAGNAPVTADLGYAWTQRRASKALRAAVEAEFGFGHSHSHDHGRDPLDVGYDMASALIFAFGLTLTFAVLTRDTALLLPALTATWAAVGARHAITWTWRRRRDRNDD